MQVMALKMRRACWNSNDKGKIVDFEQNQRRIQYKAMTPKQRERVSSGGGDGDGGGGGGGRQQRQQQQRNAAKGELHSILLQPMSLAEMVPRDAFNFESVFHIAKTKELDQLTNAWFHPKNRVSLVAKTAVEILFLPKRDFFLFTVRKSFFVCHYCFFGRLGSRVLLTCCWITFVCFFVFLTTFCEMLFSFVFLTQTYETRQLMRKKLQNPNMAHIGRFSRIFKRPNKEIQKKKLWTEYKKSVTKEFEKRHAKYALFNM